MKRFTALLIILSVLLSLRTPVLAATQHTYSTEANSGIRNEVCTSLPGTSADAYYTGQYTYAQLSELESDALLSSLRTLLTQTHTYQTRYADCRDLAVKTDCENADGVSISLIYTAYSATWNDWCNNRSGGWDREHVWPKSLGGFGNSGAGSDLHHVRPCDQTVNNTRNNYRYGNVDGGTAVHSAAYTGSLTGGMLGGGYFEPADQAKGDVARICLYVYVRYGGELAQCADITNVFESVDVLLQWCQEDPVDTWEMGRNEVVAAIQGNRNVFIDYPELAWILFGRAVPGDMTTPSGEAIAGAIPDCAHENTVLRDAVQASCGEEGYSGDTCCADCGLLLITGSPTAATGQHTFGDWLIVTPATESESGLRRRTCSQCGQINSEAIAAQDEPLPTIPASPSEPEENYQWLVYSVIAFGALLSTAVILIQHKKKST